MIGILAGEFPFDASPFFIPALLPVADLRLEGFGVGEASPGALPVHDPDLDLGHVQPTRVFGRVMELDSPQ